MTTDRISTDTASREKGPTRAYISSDAVLNNAQNFSLVVGGPLYQLLRRTRLSDDALSMVRHRTVVIALLGWLPLLILSAIQGHLWGKSVAVPFLLDLEVHIRFLIVAPILVVSELVVHQRLRPIAKAFLERNLILEDDLPQFDKAITSVFRLRNSVIVEVLLIAIVYGVGVLVVWRQFTALSADTWYAPASLTGLKLSLAGFWYSYLSLPIFQFLLLRWYFRILIWARFLWHVSRIKLALVPTHPDRVGGLGFLSNAVYAFSLLVVAHGAMVSSQIANRIFFLGAKFPAFESEIAIVAIFLLCVIFGPMLVFVPQLAQAKRTGLREYGTLAETGYRVIENPEKSVSLDVLAGARVWRVSTDLAFGAGILPATQVQGSRTWVDGVAGARLKAAVSKKAFVTAKADLGGGGSTFTYQLFGGFGYNVTPKIALIGGYRVLDVNYAKNNFLYNMNQRGPIMGLGFRF